MNNNFEDDNLFKSKRVISEELEKILAEPIKVLDHGFIRVVDYMGNDGSIVQAARVSYGKGTKQINQDKALINYLLRHRHTTPFEMCDIKFHIKLPIFVARQWIRHRTSSVNEYSARYSILEDDFYLPDPKNMCPQSSLNNQGRDENMSLINEDAIEFIELIKKDAERAYQNYLYMLNRNNQGDVLDVNKQALSRELARMNLPVNFYTEWYWKVNLHNLLHFVSLRADNHAQYEIRVYAEILLDIIKKWVPLTYEAFMEYRVGGANFSKTGIEVLKRMLKGEQVNQENSGLGKREWAEFKSIIE